MKDILCQENRWRYFCGKIIGPGLSIVLFIYVYLKAYYSLFNNVIKGPIYPLIWGFILAAIRSWVKDCLIDKKKKSIGALLWPYFINYPLTLTVIYVLGSYLLNKKEPEPYISWTILFILGFGVDSIFYLITHPGDLLHKNKT